MLHVTGNALTHWFLEPTANDMDVTHLGREKAKFYGR